jgi:hypothetical protein
MKSVIGNVDLFCSDDTHVKAAASSHKAGRPFLPSYLS